MIASAPVPNRSWRWLLVAGLGIFGIALFFATIQAQTSFAFHPINAVVLGALPLVLAVSAKYPLTFPFAIYVGLIPFDAILNYSGATYPKYVAIWLCGGLLAHALIKRRACLPPTAWFAWAAYMLYVTVSLLWAPENDYGRGVYYAMLLLFAMTTALALYPLERWEFEWAVAAIVPCGAIAGLYAMQSALAGHLTGSRVEIAINGVVADYNTFAASFVIPIAVGLALAFYSKNIFLRLANAAAVLLMMAGDFVTGSRGGFAAAVAVLLYFGIRTKYRLQTLGIMAAGAAVSLFFPQVYQRFANDPSAAGSGSGRTFIWETGMRTLSDHWLFGAGIGSFPSEYDKNFTNVFQKVFQGYSRPPHSIVVESLVELGVIGLCLVLLAWYSSFRQMKVVAPSSPRYRYRIAFEGMLIGLFGMALTIDPAYVKYMWLAQTLPLMLINAERPRFLAGRRLLR